MAESISRMKREYREWRASRKRLGTLDDLAAKYGMSKQLFLYHVKKERANKEAS